MGKEGLMGTPDARGPRRRDPTAAKITAVAAVSLVSTLLSLAINVATDATGLPPLLDWFSGLPTVTIAAIALVAIVIAAMLYPSFCRRWAELIAVTPLPFIVTLGANLRIAAASFYELAAQIVPVLFLALGFETRDPESRSGSTAEREYRIMLTVPVAGLLLAGGEALRALAMTNKDQAQAEWVIGPLVTASIALAIRAITRPLNPAQDVSGQETTSLQRFVPTPTADSKTLSQQVENVGGTSGENDD
jgi:hypothetical protein